MALEETVMDERGRITIGTKRVSKYGKRFFVVDLPDEIVLVPRPEDPIKAMQEWGKKINIGRVSAEKINKMAEEEAYKEIRQRERRRLNKGY